MNNTTQHFVVPYTWVDTDDYAYPHAAVVIASSKDAAIEAVRERIYPHADGEFWGYAAEWGDAPEHAGDDCYYVCAPCDCGEADCASEDDNGHESLTVMVNMHPGSTRECATMEAAKAAVWDLARCESHVLIDLTEAE